MHIHVHVQIAAYTLISTYTLVNNISVAKYNVHDTQAHKLLHYFISASTHYWII